MWADTTVVEVTGPSEVGPGIDPRAGGRYPVPMGTIGSGVCGQEAGESHRPSLLDASSSTGTDSTLGTLT